MKKNLRDKIHTFLQSENGKVGIKSPLTLKGVTLQRYLLKNFYSRTETVLLSSIREPYGQ